MLSPIYRPSAKLEAKAWFQGCSLVAPSTAPGGGSEEREGKTEETEKERNGRYIKSRKIRNIQKGEKSKRWKCRDAIEIYRKGTEMRCKYIQRYGGQTNVGRSEQR